MDSLKEDAPVDVYTAMTPTQLLLVWTLLGFLLAWMVTFALLALRSDAKKSTEIEEFAPSLRSSPATATSAKLRVVTPVQAHSMSLNSEQLSSDVVPTKVIH